MKLCAVVLFSGDIFYEALGLRYFVRWHFIWQHFVRESSSGGHFVWRHLVRWTLHLVTFCQVNTKIMIYRHSMCDDSHVIELGDKHKNTPFNTQPIPFACHLPVSKLIYYASLNFALLRDIRSYQPRGMWALKLIHAAALDLHQRSYRSLRLKNVG